MTTIRDFRAMQKPGIAFVPTMGALHEGHLSLLRSAAESSATVVVSIFVNPTQFGPREDYEKYPRNLERDAMLAEEAGASIVFSPSVEEMYSSKGTIVRAASVSEEFEGRIRPGHFDGVATVVCKLFQIVQPESAYFGLKDLQQCAVIKHMVRDLNIPVDVRLIETKREPDGLAMSSRNVYLSNEERSVAPHIYQTLINTRENLLNGENSEDLLSKARQALVNSGFEVDYFDLVDISTFKLTRSVDCTCALICAARLGKTRLIDNILIFPTENVL